MLDKQNTIVPTFVRLWAVFVAAVYVLRMAALLRQIQYQGAERFVDSAGALVKLGAIGLLLTLAFWRSETPRPAPLRTFLASFAICFLSVPALNLLADPRGLYDTRLLPLLGLTARHAKVEAYLEFDRPTDIALLGSSHGFTLLPEHVREATGLSAFNFTVEDAQIEDFLIQSQFMIDQHGLPPVLWVEIAPSLPTNPAFTAERMPLVLAHYMPDNLRTYAWRIRVTEAFNITQGLESAYVIRALLNDPDLGAQQIFALDGGRVYEQPADLEAIIRKDIAIQGVDDCEQPEATGRAGLIALLDLAVEHQTSVVLYLSPFHPVFYAERMENNPEYQRCYRAFLDFIANLQNSYPNLYFLDYSRLESISGVADSTGYFDYDHIRDVNADRLIAAAAPTLLEAYEYAMSLRSEP